LALKKASGADYEHAGVQLGKAGECGFDLGLGARPQDMNLQSKREGRSLHVSRQRFSAHRVIGIYEQCHDGCSGRELMSQLQPFRPYLHV
jgi:hypothetical protein